MTKPLKAFVKEMEDTMVDEFRQYVSNCWKSGGSLPRVAVVAPSSSQEAYSREKTDHRSMLASF